jgi:hypothetical protein
MTPLPTQSTATDTTGTDAFDFMTPAKPAPEDQGFDKVFREAAGEAEVAEQEKAAEDKAETQAKEEAARQKNRAKELAGLGHATPLQADLASKARVNPSEGKQAAAKGELKAEANIETQSDAAKEELQARKQSAAKQTGRLKKQQAARAQLKAEDVKQATAKADLESARQNLPTAATAKGAAVKPAQSADKTGNLPEGEWEIMNGTQFAQNDPKMAMMAKTTTPASEGSVARWEELRPATSAELGGGASSQQQDLPREQAKEFTAPVQAVATPAATGSAATQAFTPVPGQISATLEKIWNAVTTFRAKGADQLTVKLQTENQQMELTIRYNQGGLEIQARLGQGEGQQLAGQWNELQQSLAERGVTLRDLDREEAELPRFSEDLDDSNSAESRRHAAAGEDDDEPLNWGGLENNREEDEQTAPPRATARTENATWESWA